MDTTPCLGLPFPECDPPLTKDASDIIQMKNLAEAVNTVMDQVEANITEFVTAPDSALMSGGLTSAGRIQDLPFTAVEFDNASMASIPDARLRVQSTGWYYIGGWVRATSTVAAGIGVRIQPTINGDPAGGGRQGPGRPTASGPSYNDDLAWAVTLFLNEGDLVGARTNHTDSAAASITYSHRIWATRVLANV